MQWCTRGSHRERQNTYVEAPSFDALKHMPSYKHNTCTHVSVSFLFFFFLLFFFLFRGKPKTTHEESDDTQTPPRYPEVFSSFSSLAAHNIQRIVACVCIGVCIYYVYTMCVYIYIYTYVYTYTYIIYMYTYVYIYIYIYMHTHTINHI